MNYRHAYHAGNHADILKHITLTRILMRLNVKEKPYRAIDAHAGLGIYPLNSVAAVKTREWEGGIAKLAHPFSPEVEELLAPFRQVVKGLNPGAQLATYPGSPAFMAELSRPQDRLVFNELHPEDYDILAEQYAYDARIATRMVDATQLLKSDLPPPERRGLVLLDPPYEVKHEKELVIKALQFGHRRFANGVFMIWYPIKGLSFAEDFCQSLQALEIGPMMRIELRVREAFQAGGLAGSGLLIVNPPWLLFEEMSLIAPELAQRLGLGEWGRALVDWLIPPKESGAVSPD